MNEGNATIEPLDATIKLWPFPAESQLEQLAMCQDIIQILYKMAMV